MINVYTLTVEGTARKDIAELMKALPAVGAYTLNRVGFLARDAVKVEMESTFDRPTPWIRKSIFVYQAKEGRLEVYIGGSKTGADKQTKFDKILKPNIYGGGRQKKAGELKLISRGIMPSDRYYRPGRAAPLDQYGNIKSGYINSILSQVSPSKSSKMRGQARFQVITKNGVNIGILDNKTRTGELIPFALVFIRQPGYSGVYMWYETIDKSVKANLYPQWNKTLQKYISDQFKKK